MTLGGLACLWEQMCHPLATVVPFPQWPCGRRWASCGLKMIPHLTSSRVGCREGASLWAEGEGEEGRNREGVNSTHIYRINIYPNFRLGEPAPAASLYKVEKLKWNRLISLEDFIKPPPLPPIWTWKTDQVIMALKCTADFSLRLFLYFFIFEPSDSSLKQKNS